MKMGGTKIMKSELYKRLSSIVDSNTSLPEQVSRAKSLAMKIMTNKISVEDASVELENIQSMRKHPMLDTISSKPVGKSLVKLYNGSLDYDGVIKLLSSLITHSVIEKSKVGSDYCDSIKVLSETLYQLTLTEEVDVIDSLTRCGLGSALLR